MADPEFLPPSRRRAARESHSRRVRRIAGSISAGLVVVAAVLAALVLTDAVTVPGSDSAHVTAAPRPEPSTSTTRPRHRTTHRALTPDAPLRLWIAGDSLAGSVGPSLGELTAATGVVQPQYDSRVSSGLLNPSFFDWPKEATQQLAQLDPEVVVFVIGTNDANVWDAHLGDQYRLRVEAMMHQLVGSGHRQVYWVGAPVAKAKSLEQGVLNVNLIARAAAGRIHGVTYVDAHALFDDPAGQYQQSFMDDLGHRQVMRADDGVHFSVVGADYIGRALYQLLDAEWHLTTQAVPGVKKDVLETKGSTQVPGTHRSAGTPTDNTPTSTTRPGGSGTSTTSSSTSTSSTTTSTSTTTTTTTSPTPPST